LNLLHWFLCRLSSITSSVHQGTGLLLKQTKSIPYHVLEEKYHAWTFINKKEEINKIHRLTWAWPLASPAWKLIFWVLSAIFGFWFLWKILENANKLKAQVLEKRKLLVVKIRHGSHNLYWLKPVHCWTRGVPRVKLEIAWNNICYWGWDFWGLWPGGLWILWIICVLYIFLSLFLKNK